MANLHGTWPGVATTVRASRSELWANLSWSAAQRIRMVSASRSAGANGECSSRGLKAATSTTSDLPGQRLFYGVGSRSASLGAVAGVDLEVGGLGGEPDLAAGIE